MSSLFYIVGSLLPTDFTLQQPPSCLQLIITYQVKSLKYFESYGMFFRNILFCFEKRSRWSSFENLTLPPFRGTPFFFI